MGQNTPYLLPGVVIACENSPESVTLSGDADKLDVVMASLKTDKPDVLNRKLRVSKAYHSRESILNLAVVISTNCCRSYASGWERISVYASKQGCESQSYCTSHLQLISSVKGKPLMNAGDFGRCILARQPRVAGALLFSCKCNLESRLAAQHLPRNRTSSCTCRAATTKFQDFDRQPKLCLHIAKEPGWCNWTTFSNWAATFSRI